MLSSAAVRDHLPYPADMSGARTAKHHDNVLCYSGFFVAQCSFSHPLHLQSTESTTPTLQLLQFRSREIDSSSWLPSEAAKYGADPTDQATSSDVKRRNRADPTGPTDPDRSDITQEVFLWFAFGLVACSDVLECWMQCRCRHGCEILFVLQFVSALFYFLHESPKTSIIYCTFIIFYYHV